MSLHLRIIYNGETWCKPNCLRSTRRPWALMQAVRHGDVGRCNRCHHEPSWLMLMWVLGTNHQQLWQGLLLEHVQCWSWFFTSNFLSISWLRRFFFPNIQRFHSTINQVKYSQVKYSDILFISVYVFCVFFLYISQGDISATPHLQDGNLEGALSAFQRLKDSGAPMPVLVTWIEIQVTQRTAFPIAIVNWFKHGRNRKVTTKKKRGFWKIWHFFLGKCSKKLKTPSHPTKKNERVHEIARSGRFQP